MNLAHTSWSYTRHIDEESKQHSLPSVYLRPDSIDTWRHVRMLRTSLPLLEEYPGAKWITFGDGNFGSDSHFLAKNGGDALATSISDATLKVGFDKGFIKKFRAENAEKVSASDNEFDFSFCKEAYHHFPRPSIAFYEMLRVAKIGVILIEPAEGPKKLMDRFKSLVKKIIRKDESTLFEASGNFIYRISVREFEKILTALNFPFIAYLPFNDFFHPRISGGKNSPVEIRAAITRLGILIQDILCKMRLMNYGLTTMIALKIEPPPSLESRLRKAGFRITKLPQNPYI